MRPETMCFCHRKKSSKTGNMTKIVAAIIKPHWLAPSWLKRYERPIGSVRKFSEFVEIRGHKKSFHFVTTETRVTVTSMGREIGRITYHRVCR